MVPYHSYYVYATWRSKKVVKGKVLKSLYRQGKPQRWGSSFYGRELTPLDIMFTIFSLAIAVLLIDDVKHFNSKGIQG